MGMSVFNDSIIDSFPLDVFLCSEFLSATLFLFTFKTLN